MAEHTPKVSRLEVITTGAHRRWTLAEKLRIVAESSWGHREVTATARRCGLSTSYLFHWRTQVRGGGRGWLRRRSAGAGAIGICGAGCGCRGANGDQPWRGADRGRCER
jgi:hypothetical protein